MTPPSCADGCSDRHDDWINALDSFLDCEHEHHPTQPLDSIHPTSVIKSPDPSPTTTNAAAENTAVSTSPNPAQLCVVPVPTNNLNNAETIPKQHVCINSSKQYHEANSTPQPEKPLPVKNDSASDPDAAARAQARSERKRSREKQRRTDVNAQFNALTVLLRKIEADDVDDDREVGPQKKRKLSTILGSIGSGSTTNRVDLIARTIVVLEHLRSLNGKRREEVIELKKKLEEAQKAAGEASKKEASGEVQKPQDKVMMMVPMMVSPDSLPTGGCPFPMPFMPQPGHPTATYCPMPQHPTSGSAPAPTTPHAPMMQPTPVPHGAYPAMFAPGPFISNKMNPMAVPAPSAPPSTVSAPGVAPTAPLSHHIVPHHGVTGTHAGASPIPPTSAPSNQLPQGSYPNHGSGGNLAHCA